MLRLRADASDNNMEYFQWQWTYNQPRPYATPMLQTWNKFCYTEGIIEMSAQLPGLPTQGGLWPAFWLMGNLGRATAQKSTDKIWPFSYSHCPSEEDREANQDPSDQQEMNACRDVAWTAKYGLNPKQGRGAIEIDIVEAMPGSFAFDYKKWKVDSGVCAPLPEDEYHLVVSPRPMVATSLQLAPGIPYRADQRPAEVNTSHGGSQTFNCLPEDWSKQWYPELKQGNNFTYGTTYQSQPNIDFWGEYFKGEGPDAIDLQTDSLSSLNALPLEAWRQQNTYRLDWKAGPDGYTEFRMNGLLQFQVNASSATREHDITREGEYIGKMLGRQIPEEPTYIMLNIDLATRWGWPDCNSEFCDCCSDCRDPKCTTCYYPWDPQNNARQWLADLCTTLPASYDIDYVRVWQKPGNTRTSCDPADYPTQGWIESHRDRYLLPNMNEPLRPVLAGGSQCASDDDCGTALRGHCNNSTGTCQCKAEWTGPKCVARRIGTALTCCALESESIGGAACYVNSSTACGVSSGRGQCVEAARPGGSYAANQTYKLSDGSWEKAGGGDGRCKCKAGWKGTSCDVPAATCSPNPFPDPAWMGADLETFVEKVCNGSIPTNRDHEDALARACKEVLWKPHWQEGGGYAGCGAWLRANWVATVGSCGVPAGQSSCPATLGAEGDGFNFADYLWVIWAGAGVCGVLMILVCLKFLGERCCQKRAPLFKTQSAGRNEKNPALGEDSVSERRNLGSLTPGQTPANMDAGSFEV